MRRSGDNRGKQRKKKQENNLVSRIFAFLVGRQPAFERKRKSKKFENLCILLKDKSFSELKSKIIVACRSWRWRREVPSLVIGGQVMTDLCRVDSLPSNGSERAMVLVKKAPNSRAITKTQHGRRRHTQFKGYQIRVNAVDLPGTRRISTSNVAKRRSERSKIQSQHEANTGIPSVNSTEELFQFTSESINEEESLMSIVELDSSIYPICWEHLKLGIGAEMFSSEEVMAELGLFDHVLATMDDEVLLEPSLDSTINQVEYGDSGEVSSFDQQVSCKVDLEANEWEPLYCCPRQLMDHNYALPLDGIA